MESLLIIILGLEIALTIIFLSCLFICYFELKQIKLAEQKALIELSTINTKADHIRDYVRTMKFQGVTIKESK